MDDQGVPFVKQRDSRIWNPFWEYSFLAAILVCAPPGQTYFKKICYRITSMRVLLWKAVRVISGDYVYLWTGVEECPQCCMLNNGVLLLLLWVRDCIVVMSVIF